jgi:hypothetical protein
LKIEVFEDVMRKEKEEVKGSIYTCAKGRLSAWKSDWVGRAEDIVGLIWFFELDRGIS